MNTQYDWFGCLNCLSLFYNGHQGNPGVCRGAPAGRRGHQVDAFNFYVVFTTVGGVRQDVPQHSQGGWRNCWKCQVMFFDGHVGNKGACAAGGAHEGRAEDGAWNFHVQLATGPVEQQYGVANWRNCWNCQVLFYDGTDRKGVCPANGRGHDGHAHESPYNFVVMHGDLPLIE